MNGEFFKSSAISGRSVIDVRSVAAFNGWKMNEQQRGGHLPGAVSFPLKWTDFDGWKKVLQDKNITPNDAVMLYGYNDGEMETFSEKLMAAGYSDIGILTGFGDWTENKSMPLVRLAKYQQLVYPEWLHELIEGRSPPGYENDHYVIGHATYGYREDYEAGHIPGAVHIDTISLEDPETWNRRTPEELTKALLDCGITSDTTVIMYGRFSHPNNQDPYPGRKAGHLAAMRCAVIMLYAGVKDVRILNGGLAAWKEAGYELSTEEPEIRKSDDFGIQIPAHPEYIIDTPEAKRILASDDGELVSVRSWDEYIGKVSGYNYIEKRGRIPGSVFGNCGSDAYHMENYRNIDHTMRQHEEVARNWAENGVIPEKRIAFYCGTGWRASEAFLNAYLMGWPNISIYDGGWMEWSGKYNNAVETGIPESQTK